jgi:hypothetical protein
MRNLCLIAVILFASCIQKRYIHNAAPAINPMFRAKGDGFTSAAYHTNGQTRTSDNTDVSNSTSNGINLQAGYAFSNHFGVVSSFNYMNQRNQYNNLYSDPFDESNVTAKRNEFTLAGTYYLTGDNKKIGFNVLLGLTTGKFKLNDVGKVGSSTYSRYFNSNSFFGFIQPGFIIYVNDNSGIGLFTKVSSVSYNNNKTNYSISELQTLRLNNTSGIYTAEMGINASCGFDKFPLSIDGQFNYIYNHSGRIHVRRGNYSLGISYSFRSKKSKVK